MIGKNIRYYRELRGLTGMQLGAMIGSEQSTISHWETGNRTPHAKSLRKLAKALNVTVDELYTGPQGQIENELLNINSHLTTEQQKYLLAIAKVFYESNQNSGAISGD